MSVRSGSTAADCFKRKSAQESQHNLNSWFGRMLEAFARFNKVVWSLLAGYIDVFWCGRGHVNYESLLVVE